MGKPRGYWLNETNFYFELNEIIKGNNGDFPTQTYLRKNNRTDILGAMTKHYGGISTVRKEYGYEPVQKPKRYWKN